MAAVAPFQEAIDIIKEEGGEICKLCYQCGTCTGTCPWNTVRNFLVRKTMHQAQLGLPDFEDEDMWLCVTCKACVDRCPRGVEIIDVWRSFRRAIVELGIGGIPDSLRITAKNISAVGNPQGEDRETRTDWMKDLDVKTHTKGTEVLFFPCCYNSFDPPMQRVGKAFIEILKKAEVDFGVLGNEQSCCGESARKAGALQVLAVETHDDIGMVLHLLKQLLQESLRIVPHQLSFSIPLCLATLPVHDMVNVPQVTTQLARPLNQVHRKALIGQGQRCRHTSHTSPNDQNGLFDRHLCLAEWLQPQRLGYGHAHKVL